MDGTFGFDIRRARYATTFTPYGIPCHPLRLSRIRDPFLNLCSQIDAAIRAGVRDNCWRADFDLNAVRFLGYLEFKEVRRTICRNILELLHQDELLTLDGLFLAKKDWDTTKFVNWTLT